MVTFRAILPKVAALVHHGGIGTVAQALAAGIPHLVMPMGFDQPDNATRLERLGVGASIKPNKFRGPLVAKTLDWLLTSKQVQNQCQALAAKVNFKQALDDTCTIIEEFAKDIKQ